MSTFTDEARHWRERAELMIAFADQAHDPTARDTFYSIAAAYERLAELAENLSSNPLKGVSQTAG